MPRKGSSLRAVGALAALVAILGGVATGLGYLSDIAMREASSAGQTDVAKFMVQVGQIVEPRLLMIGGIVACAAGVIAFGLVRIVDWIRG